MIYFIRLVVESALLDIPYVFWASHLYSWLLILSAYDWLAMLQCLSSYTMTDHKHKALHAWPGHITTLRTYRVGERAMVSTLSTIRIKL